MVTPASIRIFPCGFGKKTYGRTVIASSAFGWTVDGRSRTRGLDIGDNPPVIVFHTSSTDPGKLMPDFGTGASHGTGKGGGARFVGDGGLKWCSDAGNLLRTLLGAYARGVKDYTD